MASYHAPHEWKEWLEWLSAGLHGRSRWRLPMVMMGILFANGRRVVASWIRAGGLSDDYQDYYYFLQSLGRRSHELGRRVLLLVTSAAGGPAGHGWVPWAQDTAPFGSPHLVTLG